MTFYAVKFFAVIILFKNGTVPSLGRDGLFELVSKPSDTASVVLTRFSDFLVSDVPGPPCLLPGSELKQSFPQRAW